MNVISQQELKDRIKDFFDKQQTKEALNSFKIPGWESFQSSYDNYNKDRSEKILARANREKELEAARKIINEV